MTTKWLYLEQSNELINCDFITYIKFLDSNGDSLVFEFSDRPAISYKSKKYKTRSTFEEIFCFLETSYNHTLRL